MDPRVLESTHWQQIAGAVELLYVFVGLTIVAALAFLLGHGVIPSLVASRDVPAPARALRVVLYPIAAASLALTLVALAAALARALAVLREIYPRFLL